MAIRPAMATLYPRNWAAISWVLRALRARWRCEGSPRYPDCRAENGKPHPATGNKVTLTVAHLNHNPADCRLSNLRVMCNRCHLVYDAPHHYETMKLKRGWQWLFIEDIPLREYEPSGALPENRQKPPSVV